MKRLLALFVMLCCLMSAACAQELRLYYVSGGDEARASYAQENPDVTFVHATGEDYISTTDELLGQLLTGSFDWDVFSQSTRFGDPQLLMRKGYCAPLSGSAIIRSHVERMWPSIAAVLTWEGEIYGIPTSMQTDFLLANDQVWQDLGYGPDDVPNTFPALLTFLNDWIDRQKEEDLPYDVLAYWDESLYGRNSYAQWLVEKLLDSHITQQQFTGGDIRFSTEEMIALLEDARDTGLRLYGIERVKSDKGFRLPLFLEVSDAWGKAQDWLVSLRLRTDQPELLPVILSVCCVHAGSPAAPAAVKYLETLISHPAFVAWHDALFYQDAQPIPDPYLPDQLTYVTTLRDILVTLREHPDTPLGDIADLASDADRLESYQHWYQFMQADPDPDQVQQRIDRWNHQIEEMQQDAYLFSPAQLEDYAAFTDKLYFPVPGPHSMNTEGGQQMRQLAQRFVDGQLSARQLTQELDRMTRMIELENQ